MSPISPKSTCASCPGAVLDAHGGRLLRHALGHREATEVEPLAGRDHERAACAPWRAAASASPRSHCSTSRRATSLHSSRSALGAPGDLRDGVDIVLGDVAPLAKPGVSPRSERATVLRSTPAPPDPSVAVPRRPAAENFLHSIMEPCGLLPRRRPAPTSGRPSLTSGRSACPMTLQISAGWPHLPLSPPIILRIGGPMTLRKLRRVPHDPANRQHRQLLPSLQAA